MSGDLSLFTDEELRAELRRREEQSRPRPVYFYGVWPGHRHGHHLYDANGRRVGWDEEKELVTDRLGGESDLTPYDLRDPCAPRGAVEEIQPEGVFRWRVRGGLTLLTAWDRSADPRGGSFTAFLVRGSAAREEMLMLARDAFPRVFARIEAKLGPYAIRCE